MADTVQFFGASGVEHTQGGNGRYEIVNYADGAAADTVNRLGFFGATGPGSPVVVNTYQTKTYPTDDEGDSAVPPFVQLKYLGAAATVEVSGAYSASTAEVGFTSGTIMVRFTQGDGTQVQTQNAYLEALKFTGDNWPSQNEAPENLNVYAFECQHPFEHAITNGTWVKLAGTSPGGGGTGQNQLAFTNQAWLSDIHDWCAAISVSPTAVGTNIAWGLYVQLEYL